MHCQYCGQDHPEEAVYCPITGKSLKRRRNYLPIFAIATSLLVGVIICIAAVWILRQNCNALGISMPFCEGENNSLSQKLETKTPELSATISSSLTTAPEETTIVSTNTPDKLATAAAETVEARMNEPPSPSETPNPITPTPTPTEISTFYACLEPCSSEGTNSSRTFPERTTKIYLRWEYENIPIGSSYVRRWTMDNLEWVRYECTWPGPENGIEEITLTEPSGLHSGLWEMMIIIDGVTFMKEQIEIVGNWDYWHPAGVFDTCYGKR